MNKYTEIVSLLISNSVDINSKNMIRNTSLHCAASRGHTEIGLLLINNGADINSKNNVSKYIHMSPLHDISS